jgi:hypothetical protein
VGGCGSRGGGWRCARSVDSIQTPTAGLSSAAGATDSPYTDLTEPVLELEDFMPLSWDGSLRRPYPAAKAAPPRRGCQLRQVELQRQERPETTTATARAALTEGHVLARRGAGTRENSEVRELKHGRAPPQGADDRATVKKRVKGSTGGAPDQFEALPKRPRGGDEDMAQAAPLATGSGVSEGDARATSKSWSPVASGAPTDAPKDGRASSTDDNGVNISSGMGEDATGRTGCDSPIDGDHYHTADGGEGVGGQGDGERRRDNTAGPGGTARGGDGEGGGRDGAGTGEEDGSAQGPADSIRSSTASAAGASDIPSTAVPGLGMAKDAPPAGWDETR